MNAKTYLSRVYCLDLQVKSKLEQIEVLKSLAARVSASFGSEPVSHTLNVTAMQDTVARIMEAEEDLQHRISELVEMKLEVSGVIDRVEDVYARIILEKRYLCFQSWMHIAADLNYSERYVHMKHGEGLRAVQQILG